MDSEKGEEPVAAFHARTLASAWAEQKEPTSCVFALSPRRGAQWGRVRTGSLATARSCFVLFCLTARCRRTANKPTP